MLALLDVETRPFHAEADRSWEHLLTSSGDARSDYAHRLAVAYGFEAPLEISRRYTPHLPQQVTLPLHERAGLIVRTLLALGWTADDITGLPCASFSLFSEVPEALAWMYVIERSVLIQSEVRQRLASRFVDIATATAGLATYDGTASPRRAELGIALDHLCSSESVYGRVIDAARTGFGALIEWQRAMDTELHTSVEYATTYSQANAAARS